MSDHVRFAPVFTDFASCGQLARLVDHEDELIPVTGNRSMLTVAGWPGNDSLCSLSAIRWCNKSGRTIILVYLRVCNSVPNLYK